MASVILKRGRDKSVSRRHPWIFSGAIARVEGTPQVGQTVDVVSAAGDLLARGAYSPRSQIAVRIWSFDPNEDVSVDLMRQRLESAIRFRPAPGVDKNGTASRLVNAESDRLPGLIVDRYGDFLVCQFLSAGAEYWKEEIVAQLKALVSQRGIFERSDVDVREKEGLPLSSGIICGEDPPDLIEICEGPLQFKVDIRRGHKTGFYLDQRRNRACMSEYAQGAEVLNCFAYTGGFGIWALKYGAERVTNIESASSALALASQNVELNGLDTTRTENIEGDVFQVMRRHRDSGRRFDLIILDPPKFVMAASQLRSASRGYKDINLLAFKMLKPGGVLFTFSCSSLMEAGLFQKIVADAALDAKKDAQIIRRLSQADDHPTALSFPEGSYLKGLVCRVC
jgi:23S rRNA (cytosine1962-C5)-methyltransferase